MFRRVEQRQKPIRAGIPPALFYGMFVLLLGGNAISGTALLMAPDIARLMGGQNELVVAAYEDRLAQMRVEIDRLQSRSYAQAGDINLQLQELSQQQDVLLEQHQLVKALVDKADQLGIASVELPDAPSVSPTTASGNPDVAATAASVNQMITETQQAMVGIASAANARTQGIVSELKQLGIALDLPEAGLNGVGGPLIEAVTGESSPMIEDANAVMDSLLRYKAARDSVEQAPISVPITANYRLTSSFGNRKDPFTGRLAFHSGMDFAAPAGTPVYSAAAGTVTFVGTNGGYGKVVEVSHANGLMTRYPHLSAQLVNQGQKVSAGTPVGQVGSTGRSTGPHLHFEVRRGEAAVDPRPFIDAGERLRALLG